MKFKERQLEKGELFRLGTKGVVSPEIWTWDGYYINPEEEHGYLIRRLSDDFILPIMPEHYIVPIDMEELEDEEEK